VAGRTGGWCKAGWFLGVVAVGRASAKTDYSSGHGLISSNLKRDAILGLHDEEDPPQNQS